MLSKFMQSLGDSAYTKLRKIADDRDITVQELIRAIVIPDWLKLAEAHDGEPWRRSLNFKVGNRQSFLDGSSLEFGDQLFGLNRGAFDAEYSKVTFESAHASGSVDVVLAMTAFFK